jgi:hypothetical protein
MFPVLPAQSEYLLCSVDWPSARPPARPRPPGSKCPRALSCLPEKDSTKLSGLDVNVGLIGEIREQDGTTGGDEKGMEESVIPEWFCDDNFILITIDNAIGRQRPLGFAKSL